MFQQVVGTAIAYLDLDTTGFNTKLGNAWQQLKSIGDESLTLGQKFQSAGQGMQSIGSSMTRTFTLPIATGMAFATKKTMDFEEAMSNVQALAQSGMTNVDDEMKQLRQRALDLGGTTKFTSKEVADAFGYMALAGWKTEDMLEGIDGVLNLAASSNMDLAMASDIVTDYLSAYGLEAKDAAHMSDMMAYAQANANTTTQQLGDAFGNSASFMHTAGQEMNTTIALLAAMANQGLKGSEAGTALSAVMRDIVQKMDDGKIAIGDVDVAVQDSEGNFRDLTDILADVEKATEGMGSSEKTAALMMTFTSRSIKGLGTILTEGSGKVKSFKDQLDGADGTAEKISKTMLDNLAGSITYLTSALDNFLIKVGDRLAPYIRKFADWLTEITNKLTSMSDEEFDQMVKIAGIVAAAGPLLIVLGKITSGIGGIINIIGKLSGAKSMMSGMIDGCHGFGTCVGQTAGKLSNLGNIFKTIGTVVGGVIKTISGIAAVIGGVIIAVKNFVKMWQNGWDIISTILEALGIALAAIGAILLGAPALITAIIAAVVFAVSQIVIVIHDHWDQIVDWWQNTVKPWFAEKWQSFKDWLSNLGQSISEWWDSVKQKFSEWTASIKEWFDDLIKKQTEWLTSIFNKIKEWFDNLIAKQTEWLLGIYNKVKEFFSNLINHITEKIAEIWNNLKQKAQEIWNGIVEFFQKVFDKLKEVWETIIDSVRSFFQRVTDFVKNLFDNLMSFLSGLFEKIKSIISGMIETIKGLIDKFIEIVTKIFDTFKSVVETIVKTIGDIVQKVIDFVKQVIQKALEVIQNLWEKITNFVEETFTKITDKLKSLFEALWEWIKDLPGKFIEIGKNIINKIWEGMKEAWNNFWEWLTDKFSWIEDLLGRINDIKEKVKNTAKKVTGSHANGLDYVPYDGYVAELHKGERVLTRSENESYNSGRNYSTGDTYNFYNTKDDPYEYARQIKRTKRELAF